MRRTRPAAPLVASVFALLLGAVVVSQGLIVLIVFALPPPTPTIYALDEVAARLRGEADEALRRTLVNELPKTRSGGAGPDDPRRRALAATLGVGVRDVWIAETLRERRGPFSPPPGFGFRRETKQRSRLVLVGHFGAAVRQGPDRWVLVSPPPEPFPNAWQRRLLGWGLACVAVMALAAWSFARRLTRPIAKFADAAERLGRDLSGPPVALSGSSELHTLEQAFNGMQARLQRYVEDRTTMIAAIAHDLRTPLTRLRFRLECAPPAMAKGAQADIAEMEAMIAAVFDFVRETRPVDVRSRLELVSLLESLADDMAVTGADVTVEAPAPLVVEADGAALRRLFANLFDNAVKYGGFARVKAGREGDDAVVHVDDEGPGLPEAELERLFEPFRRGEPSRNRDTGGIGLGLTVARSIARAHGGDVTLHPRRPGLSACVRLPLSPTPSGALP